MSDQDATAGGHSPVHVSGFLRCTSMEEVAAVRQHLPEHTRLTCAEPGCLWFEVVQTDDPLVWRIEESFVDMAAFQAHADRSRASAWWDATSGIARELEVVGDGGR